jgi:transposase-like protein
VVGILQRGGNVYTEVVPDCARKTFHTIIRGKVDPDSIIHSDRWRGYSGLVDLGYKKHYRVHHEPMHPPVFTAFAKHLTPI